ncbi:GntR family transcriptional regulator [Paracoccus sp. ME4]|uniref:GntR family transcriptional regulator n=1 Tax=Paracoccus sp. ME4 TaxID=3138066 RepID=UPI00398BAD1A
MYDKQSPFASRPERGDSLAEAALSALRAAIVGCQIPPGSAVSEAELAKRFGFGLAPVRAAVMRLSAAGWIAPDGRRGSVILAVSAEHLADLAASRACLEPSLTRTPPPRDLSEALSLRATVRRAAAHQGPSADRVMGLHQDRELLTLIAGAVAAPRLRGWLIDTWDLSLRADLWLERTFGLARASLPLADLAAALAEGREREAADVLAAMRAAFDARIAAALSRSGAPLVPPAAPKTPAPRTPTASASKAAPRPSPSSRPTSPTGDPA